jgi:RimJ/RimL family protein N-acetyltransferase
MGEKMNTIKIRKAIDSDLPIYFDFQLDTDFNHMAAFTSANPSDRVAFDAHWAKIMINPNIPISTITVDGLVVGSVLSYVMFEERQVAFSIGKEYWGKGYATQGLELFLDEVSERPFFARAAKDNLGSIRVLEKNGFEHVGEEMFFADARGEEIAEVVMKLG